MPQPSQQLPSVVSPVPQPARPLPVPPPGAPVGTPAPPMDPRQAAIRKLLGGAL